MTTENSECFQTTYEELKLEGNFPHSGIILRVQTTYEELKRAKPLSIIVSQSFQTTYEELKHTREE